MVSLFVIMPLFAVSLALLFDLPPAVKIALVALAVSPIPPILPKKELKAGGRQEYAISLLVSASVLATILLPLSMKLLGSIFGVPLQMTAGTIAVLALKTIFVPLSLGIALRIAARALADRVAGPVVVIGTVLLLLSVLPILFTERHAIISLIGNGTLIAFAAFSLVGICVGHLLGAPGHENSTVLALSTASRHPGVAIAIAQANFPRQRLALAAVLLFLVVNIVVSIPYIKLSKPSAKSASEDSQRWAA